MGKMAVAPQKRVLEQNFQLPTLLKFGSPVFRVLMETQNWCWPLQKMGKMAVVPQKCVLEQNLQLPNPLKFGSPHESVLEQRFSFYPTSHLCVVLHFLIFACLIACLIVCLIACLIVCLIACLIACLFVDSYAHDIH